MEDLHSRESEDVSSRTVIRLRCDASGNGDQVYIDDIEIERCGSRLQSTDGVNRNSDKGDLSSSEYNVDQSYFLILVQIR